MQLCELVTVIVNKHHYTYKSQLISLQMVQFMFYRASIILWQRNQWGMLGFFIFLNESDGK